MAMLKSGNYCKRCGLKVPPDTPFCVFCVQEMENGRIPISPLTLYTFLHWIVATPCSALVPPRWFDVELDGDWTILMDNCADGSCRSALELFLNTVTLTSRPASVSEVA